MSSGHFWPDGLPGAFGSRVAQQLSCQEEWELTSSRAKPTLATDRESNSQPRLRVVPSTSQLENLLGKLRVAWSGLSSTHPGKGAEIQPHGLWLLTPSEQKGWGEPGSYAARGIQASTRERSTSGLKSKATGPLWPESLEYRSSSWQVKTINRVLPALELLLPLHSYKER